ncbi:dephospho-CoA kinase [Halteromyces radiatus]|uniref:dephospho-CoA kinase n=1 Tax=Halteromyces radiatus TaxID=101107 RepID=UPI00221E4D19|nr:dephospho-CoA kinase [Halteromyces radiatus]KAI8081623.1 dephospho-CoA kinase [Halteromyces radiatus]
MKLVGLTGGIASGKSTVSKLLQEQHIPIIDADKIARQVVEPGRWANKLIRKHFGDEVFLPDGNLNRAKLGEVVFADPAKRKVLNSCTHPAIRLEMFKQVVYHWITGAKVVILDVPLLFESKLDRFVGTTVVVYCSEILQLQRLVKRDGLDEELATQRMRAQTPLSEKVELADIVIDNSSDLSQLSIQVKNLIKKITPSTTTWLLEYIGPPALFASFIVAIRHYSVPLFNNIISKSIKS